MSDRPAMLGIKPTCMRALSATRWIAVSAVSAFMASLAILFPPSLTEEGAGFDALDMGRPPKLVTLQVPASPADDAIPICVQTSLDSAAQFQIDIDLNHDGRFTGAGELAYAKGVFANTREGRLRLHGLAEGTYRARARVRTAAGREFVSAVRAFKVAPAPGSLPVSFEPNQGQTDSAVLFLARAKNQTVFITATETVLVQRRGESGPSRTEGRSPRSERRGRQPARQDTVQSTRYSLLSALSAPRPPLLPPDGAPTPTAPDISHAAFVSVQCFRLLGANSLAQPAGHKKLPGISNYFIGNDPAKWRTNIETFQAVVTPQVYPGIDLIHHSNQGRLQYD